MNFNPLIFSRTYRRDNYYNFEKPRNWLNMIEICKILSSPFPLVRVDLYTDNKKIYFGELTFYPGNGTDKFYPIEWDYKLGDMIILPKRSDV